MSSSNCIFMPNEGCHDILTDCLSKKKDFVSRTYVYQKVSVGKVYLVSHGVD